MKPTQITELLANIKKSFVSFFSILMFAALGVGVFLGISWTAPALQDAADKAIDEGRFHNFQIQYVYGLTDDDLEKLAEVEGVNQVETAHQSFQTLKRDGVHYAVKVQSIGHEIDVPIVREGSLPEKVGEMAIHAESAKTLGISVGDTITFEHDVAKSAPASNTTAGTEEPSAMVAADTSDGMRYLNAGTFKVTAIIDTADYMAKSAETYGYSNAPSGAVDALAWVPDETFDPAAFQNGYPVVNIACEGLSDKATFTNEYRDASAVIQNCIKVLGETLGAERFADLHARAQAQLDDAERQLNEGKQKIADGEKQLEDGRAELATKKAEAEQKLADGYQQLQSYESLRADAENQLATAQWLVSEGDAAIAAADSAKATVTATANEASAYKADQDAKLAKGEITLEQYNANLDAYGASITSRLEPYASMIGQKAPVIDHTNFDEGLTKARSLVDNFENIQVTYQGQTMTVGQARVLLNEAHAQLSAAQAEYNQRVAQLDAGWAAYYAGQDELNRLVTEGEQKIADGENELANAKAQVAEKEPKFEAAKKDFEAMKEREWAVLPRAYNAGNVEVTTFSNVTNNLSISMAALFIIVGLLVSYFAVSRLVREQVAQIGTKKALGFHKGEITRSFLLYSGMAVLAGAIIGAIVGYIVVEGIIGSVLGGMFFFGSYPPYFGWPLFIAITLLELGLVLGATYLACRGILKQHAVELLRGVKPPSGKTRFYEKWGIWERLPLFVQTIVNNCVNDKRRMLSTIVGVAGSTALIVTAITLNNDVLKSYDRHYEDAYGFNAIAYVDNTVEDAAQNVESALKAEGATTSRVFMKRYLMEQPDGESGSVRIVVPLDNDTFSQVFHVNSTTGDAVDLSAEGAWVSQAYGEHFGVKVGDVITVDGGDGSKHDIPILGFYKFWLTYHEMVMSADYFQKEFGDVSANTVLAQTGDVSVDDARKSLSSVAGFDSIVDDAAYQHKNFETFSSVSGAVVAIYLALAALMAIVVLLNLNVMFIDEKKRELIVLMINGFSVKDAKHYISYDSLVLTILGIIAGIVLGCLMGSITVAAIEPETGVFVKSVDLWAVIIGILGSAALALIMSAIALRRIPKFELTDINKQ